MRTTSAKNCTCHTCKRDFHHQGIAAHRASHQKKQQRCEITYTNGARYVHPYDKRGPTNANKDNGADTR